MIEEILADDPLEVVLIRAKSEENTFNVDADGFRIPAPRFRVPTPGPGSLPPGLGPTSGFQAEGRHDLHHKYRFLNLKKEVGDVLDQSSQFHSRQGKVPYLEDLLLRHAYDRLNPCDYCQLDEEICSLEHIYSSTYWLRPRSPAHQQGPSMLTEAPRHIMLTAAYRQVYYLFRPCLP
ncbi:hypothetical protein DY000_02021359 [Brassica cretica]|uniref:Uncharacterized protein n=1 Tax=Brassica cretica TaxID=69181 RepID=A0ABQ7ELH7_BRACR|nr:hypothetical protein DY000_02021359 [Brassica cretica]